MAAMQTGTASQTHSRRRYALVTPVRNEEAYIEAMLDSILAQEILPSRWIIVDDGSSDRTPQIIASYAKRTRWIELIRMPARRHRYAGGENAVSSALERINVGEYDYLGRFDADLVFDRQYIAQVLGEFENDPRLGIAGGGLYADKNGRLELEREPDYHVRGAVKMYRRECFEHIGGLRTHIGWDTIDEVYAWSRGWTTRSFSEYRVYHRRPTGAGLRGSRVCWERGKAEYYTWSDPLFVLAKTAALTFRGFPNLQSFAFLSGFLSCYLRQEDRLRDATFVRTRRGQQRRRMSAFLTRLRRIGWPTTEKRRTV